MSWAAEVRRAHIGQMLREKGRFNRSDLMTRFRVSSATASKDIDGFIKENPEAMTYDVRVKAYVPKETNTNV